MVETEEWLSFCSLGADPLELGPGNCTTVLSTVQGCRPVCMYVGWLVYGTGTTQSMRRNNIWFSPATIVSVCFFIALGLWLIVPAGCWLLMPLLLWLLLLAAAITFSIDSKYYDYILLCYFLWWRRMLIHLWCLVSLVSGKLLIRPGASFNSLVVSNWYCCLLVFLS